MKLRIKLKSKGAMFILTRWLLQVIDLVQGPLLPSTTPQCTSGSNSFVILVLLLLFLLFLCLLLLPLVLLQLLSDGVDLDFGECSKFDEVFEGDLGEWEFNFEDELNDDTLVSVLLDELDVVKVEEVDIGDIFDILGDDTLERDISGMLTDAGVKDGDGDFWKKKKVYELSLEYFGYRPRCNVGISDIIRFLLILMLFSVVLTSS